MGHAQEQSCREHLTVEMDCKEHLLELLNALKYKSCCDGAYETIEQWKGDSQ